jgi:hypothetical protein
MRNPHRLLAASVVLAVIALSPHHAPAQSTVNYEAGPSQRDVLGLDGNPLADGNYVSIGTFNPGFDAATFSRDLVALGAAWKEYDSTTIRSIFGQPGRFSDEQLSYNTTFDNQQIWIWIFQTPTQSAPDASFSNVSGYGLFTSSALNWYFPAQGGQPLDMTIAVNSDEINQPVFGLLDPTHLMLQPVPEPTLIPILLVGTGLLYGWTRRNFGVK